MMTPGALLLRFRQTFGHGVRAAYYRDIVRPRILKTAPITGTTDKTAEIHVLTSASDWLNLIWTLKSFYAVSPRRLALCIHADASLSDEAATVLKTHFPDSRLIRRAEADRRMPDILKHHPRCTQLRQNNVLALKVFDFPAFLESDRMALFDSDLLFFSKPTAYLSRLENPDYRLNTFNADIASAYTVSGDLVRETFGFDLHARVNSGMGLVHADSMPLDWVEEFLALPDVMNGYFWRVEQTLYALCSSRYGMELLPEDYGVSLAPGLQSRVFRHYVGAIRHLMYEEGMAALVRGGLLASLRHPANRGQRVAGIVRDTM